MELTDAQKKRLAEALGTGAVVTPQLLAYLTQDKTASKGEYKPKPVEEPVIPEIPPSDLDSIPTIIIQPINGSLLI